MFYIIAYMTIFVLNPCNFLYLGNMFWFRVKTIINSKQESLFCKNIKPKLQYLHKHNNANNKKFTKETKTSDGTWSVNLLIHFSVYIDF